MSSQTPPRIRKVKPYSTFFISMFSTLAVVVLALMLWMSTTASQNQATRLYVSVCESAGLIDAGKIGQSETLRTFLLPNEPERLAVMRVVYRSESGGRYFVTAQRDGQPPECLGQMREAVLGSGVLVLQMRHSNSYWVVGEILSSEGPPVFISSKILVIRGGKSESLVSLNSVLGHEFLIPGAFPADVEWASYYDICPVVRHQGLGYSLSTCPGKLQRNLNINILQDISGF